MGICTYNHIQQFLIMSLDNSHMYVLQEHCGRVKSEVFWKQQHNQDRRLLASFNTPSPILNHDSIDVVWTEIIDHLWTWTCSNHLQLWCVTLVHCPVADSVHASFWHWHPQWSETVINPFCWYSIHCKTGSFPCIYAHTKVNYDTWSLTIHKFSQSFVILCITCVCVLLDYFIFQIKIIYNYY